jgi:putative endonuclease
MSSRTRTLKAGEGGILRCVSVITGVTGRAQAACSWKPCSRPARLVRSHPRSLFCPRSASRFGTTSHKGKSKEQVGKSTDSDVTQGTDVGAVGAEYVGVAKTYYVYIMSSQRRVLYIGITSNILKRVFQHKAHTFAGFTAKYNVTNLVYFEQYGSVRRAIAREKELKDWRREKKTTLIEASNPKWRDLSHAWYQRHRFQPI